MPLTVSVVAHSLGSGRTDRSRQSSPQAPAAQSPPQAPAQPAQPQPTPIQDNAKGKIAAVCEDASLTAEKKRESIQEINEQTDQEIAKIIPAKQLEAVKECEAQQDQERAKHQGAKTQKELGPCGGVIPRQPEAPKHSHGKSTE